MGTGKHKPFHTVYPQARCVSPENIYNGAVDAVVIWGGADISPSIYGEKPSLYSGASEELSYRDRVEKEVCEAAITTGIPIIGVCRGAQLLCALAGGKLVQHVTGHHDDHRMTTDDGRVITTTSVHHQMMYPWDVEHKLIAWASKSRSTVYAGPGSDNITELPRNDSGVIEPEVVYFPKIRGLAIQGHPEFCYGGHNQEFVDYCNELVAKYLIEGAVDV
jgi:gamma-glutamyl-gamma-aminobutyrate hydrolase PuuD